MTTLLVKMLASAFALALVLASSADAAQQRKPRKPVATRTTTGMITSGYWGTNLFPPGPIMYGNQYLGNDPDPFIRSQIQRDLGAHFGGSD